MSDLDRTVGTTDVARSVEPPATAVGVPEPGETEPGATQRGETQRGETERGETEPGATQRGATEPGAAQPGASEATAYDASASEVAATEAGASEAAATDSDVPETSALTSPSEVWRLSAVAGVHMELPSANPEIVIHESQHPWRELRIPVGMAEGTAIAYAFRGIPTPRPLTHELFTEILERHAVSVEAVRITVRRGQLFHAELDTMGPRGRQVVPCRPSDAIALLLRQHMPTPLLVAEWVFSDARAEDGGAP